MKKSDLKTGSLVQTKNGQWWFVAKDIINEIDKNIIVNTTDKRRCFVYLSSYEEDLYNKNNEDYDIVKIAKCGYCFDFFCCGNANVKNLIDFEIIWEREEKLKKEIELENLINKLQRQLKETENELNKIKNDKNKIEYFLFPNC